MPLERSEAEILGAHADAIRADFRKVVPATILAVNGQKVDVQIDINSTLFDEINTAISVPAASLSGVPYCSLRAGGFSLWIPPTVGDSVLIIFSDLSYDTWQARNRGDPPVDPGWKGFHTADSPFAIPCIAPATQPLTTAPSGSLVIGKDGSDEQIVISGSDIKLGAGASNFVALANLVATELGKIATALTSIVVTIPVTSPAGTPSAGTGTAAYSPAPVAATLVKAE
jgi:hypothetical protein